MSLLTYYTVALVMFCGCAAMGTKELAADQTKAGRFNLDMCNGGPERNIKDTCKLVNRLNHKADNHQVDKLTL